MKLKEQSPQSADWPANGSYAHKLFSRLFPRIFLGYFVLAGCVLIFLAGTPGQSFFLGLYTERFIEEFGMNRASVSSIFALAFVCSAVAVQVTGKIVDRFGATRAIFFAAFPYICGIVLTCTANGPAAVAAGFVLTRVLGPDGVDFTAKVIINRWFRRMRGRAMAVASVTVAVEILLSGAFDRLSDAIGWRKATAGAAAACAVLIAAALLILSDSPEAVGLAPDGDAPPPAIVAAESGSDTPPPCAAAADEPCFTPGQALRTRTGWALLCLGFWGNTGWGGLNVHMRSVCAEQGLPPETITTIYTAIGAATPVGSIAMGWALDRAAAPRRLQVYLAVPVLSIATMILAAHMGAAGPAAAPAVAAAFGASTGLFLGSLAVFLGTAAATAFGRGPHLASIQALIVGAGVLGVAAGPLLLSAGREAAGAYRPPLLAAAAVVAVHGMILARCGPPPAPAAAAPGPLPPTPVRPLLLSPWPGPAVLRPGDAAEARLGLRSHDALAA